MSKCKLVPVELIDRFPEINPNNYNHDDARTLNAWGVELVLAAVDAPAVQGKPAPQSPPDDPLGGLEHRADGESNFYTLSRPTGNWVARIQFNGELHTHEQERILNAMLGDRNVRYGDGYHQGYWDARQDSPDVSALVEALEQCITSMLDSGYRTNAVVIRAARHALAAHRKGGGDE